MNPDQQHNPHDRVSNDLTVMQPGEQKLFTVKRHPAGIIAIYAMTALVLAIIAGLAFAGLPQVVSEDMRSEALRWGGVVFLIFAIFAMLYNLIATKIYWGNSWVVTSDSLTQISQTNLFDRQSSQLSLHSIEDVSAEQNGILTHVLGYGVLKVQTAGEHSKFHFNYCPNPNYYAREVLAARENFMISGGHEAHQQAPAAQHQEPQPNQTPPSSPPPYDQSGFNSNV